MRIFLASDGIGNHANKLSELVGNTNRKTLIISNARDFKTPEGRLEIVNHDIALLRNAGLEPVELDLRPYFGKSEELHKYVEEYQPGLIFVMGGNLFLAATAFHESGMDGIIREGLAADAFAYAGYSAGSMVAAKDLEQYLDSYGKDDDRYDQAIECYGKAYTKGLGIVDEYICPHADRDRYAKLCEDGIRNLSARGLTPIALKDSDAFIIKDEAKRTYID